MSAKRRRLINIGPGLVIALILSVVLVGRYASIRKEARLERKSTPIVERKIIVSNDAGPTPEVSFILERRETLKLDRRQIKSLQGIQTEWLEYSKPRMKRAEASSENTGKYLDKAKRNRTTPVAQLNERMAEVVEISGELSKARSRYWDQAIGLLTADQRALLQREREDFWSQKMKSYSDSVNKKAGK